MEATDAREIVSLWRKNGLHVSACALGCCDIPIAKSSIYLDVRLFWGFCVIVGQCRRHGVVPCTFESPEHFFIRRKPQDAQKRSHRKTALAVYLHINTPIRVRFYFNPHTAGWNYLCCKISSAL